MAASVAATLLGARTSLGQTPSAPSAQQRGVVLTKPVSEQSTQAGSPVASQPVSVEPESQGTSERARGSERAAAETSSEAETRYRKDSDNARVLRRLGGELALGSYVATATLISVVLVTPHILGALFHNDDVDASGDTTSSSDNAKTSHLLPLYVPLAGPIWALSYSDVNKDFGSWFWWGLLGTGQLAGSALYVTGVATAPKKVADTTAVSGVSVLPLFDAHGNRGICVVGRF